MDNSTVGLDDLVRQIVEHLSETDRKYRAFVADRIGASYVNDDDVLQGVDAVLMDPNTDGQTIVDLANNLLSPNFSYLGDSLVTVTHSERPAFAM